MGDLARSTRACDNLRELGGVSFRNQLLSDQLISNVELLSPLLESGVASGSDGLLFF